MQGSPSEISRERRSRRVDAMSKPRRHAEIAGGGLAGLTAAAALAHRGWSVRVHERHPSLRIEGFGITLLENGLRVLEAVGAAEQAIEDGHHADVRVNRGKDGTLLSSHVRPGRSYRISRHRLVTALATVAEKLGVEVVYNSPCLAATADGTLILEDGRRFSADLVVAADGVNSPLRESLGLLKSRTYQRQGALRVLLPLFPGDFDEKDAGVSTEWWSGPRRILFAPCSSSEIYAALVSRDDDDTGMQTPIDVQSWAAAFPQLDKFIHRMRLIDWSNVRWAPFQIVKLKQWSSGRVAVIGDAAHAMPPNLGQGGGSALMTGLSLAHALDQNADIGEALREWERNERPLIEHTQKWSVIYGGLAQVPRVIRHPALWIINNYPSLRKGYQRAANHHPTGADDTLSWRADRSAPSRHASV